MVLEYARLRDLPLATADGGTPGCGAADAPRDVTLPRSATTQALAAHTAQVVAGDAVHVAPTAVAAAAGRPGAAGSVGGTSISVDQLCSAAEPGSMARLAVRRSASQSPPAKLARCQAADHSPGKMDGWMDVTKVQPVSGAHGWG
jgi:hypothetical protein